MTSTYLRAVACWLLTTVAAMAVGSWAFDGKAPTAGTLEEQVAATAALAVTLCAAWAWWVVSVVSLEALRVTPRSAAGVPDWARRLVFAAVGSTLLGAAVGVVPAQAGARPAEPVDRRDSGPAFVLNLDRLPLPDRPTGGVAAIRRVVSAAVQPAGLVVAAGDSLWSIAAQLQPHDAAPTAVATRTAALYDLNRDVVGDDPDLIYPGQHLTLPATSDRSRS
ncbi:MAG: LysM peptidoglycan-binding domain-containing protein [Nocardioides sp.]